MNSLPQLVAHGETDLAPLAGHEAQEPEEFDRGAGGQPAGIVGAQQEPDDPAQQRGRQERRRACAASQQRLHQEGVAVQRPEGGRGGGGARGTGRHSHAVVQADCAGFAPNRLQH